MTNIDLTAWKQRAPMPLPRAGCAAGVVGDRLVVAGGTYWREGKKFWDKRVDAFDPIANRWTPLASLSEPRGDAAAATHGGAFYVFGGGSDGVAESSVIRHRHEGWEMLPRMALPAPRRSSGAVVLDGTFYLLGGLTGKGSDFASATCTVWAARPGAEWEARAPLPGPARITAAVGAVAGRIIVAGGCTPENGTVRNLDEILAYDPGTDRWSVLGRLPFPCRGACGLADDDRLLLIGGYTDGFITQIFSVDPLTGRTAVVGGLPAGLADTRFLRIGTRVIGVTGENGVKMRFPETIEATVV